MTYYTIITTETTIEVEADRFVKNGGGDLYLYNGDDDESDPVGHVEGEKFVGIFDSEVSSEALT